MTDKKKNDQKLFIHFGIMMYMIYTLFIVLENYIVYFTGINLLPSYFCAFLLVSIIIFLLRKKIEFSFSKVTTTDIIVVIICVLTFGFRMAFPDHAYDTWNYHIYFQELLGRDFVHYDFFPMRAINAHSFVLGDQMHYPFRLLLGFRLGTFLNTLVIILIYFQVKKIINSVIEESDRKYNRNIICIISFLIVFIEIIWKYYNSYYVDILALPFLLEIIFIIVDNDDQNTLSIGVIAFCAGTSISIKISNGIPLIILALIYLVKFRKSIKFQHILVAIFTGVFCFGIYMIISYRMTGNPIFPYANKIFHSPYFTDDMSVNAYNGLATRYGAHSLKQWLLWPLYIILNPQQCGSLSYTGRLLLIFIFLFLYIIVLEKENKVKNTNLFIFLFIALYVCYMTVCSGNLRYMPLMELVGGIMCFLIIDTILKECGKYIKNFLVVILCILTIIQSTWFAKTYYKDDYGLERISSIISDWESYKLNAKCILMDEMIENETNLDIKGIKNWMIVYSVSLPEVLLNKNARMISMQDGVTNSKTQEMYDNILEEIKNEDVYTAVDLTMIPETMNILNSNGWQVEEFYMVETTFTYEQYPIVIMKIRNTYEIQNAELNIQWNDNTIYDLAQYDQGVELQIGMLNSSEQANSANIRASLLDSNNNEVKCLFDGIIKKTDASLSIEIDKSDLQGKKLLITNKDGSCAGQGIMIGVLINEP